MEENKPKPALYNPTKISLFGFFFTPIAGAWLQHRNWLTLKELAKADACYICNWYRNKTYRTLAKLVFGNRKY